MSRRQQKRDEFLEKNKDRIERLVGKYGSSDAIRERIVDIERNISNGKDLKELESLYSGEKILKQWESVEKKNDVKVEKILKNDNINDNDNDNDSNNNHLLLSLKKKSVFWDSELNPLGRQPRLVKMNYGFKGNYIEPFLSNINDNEINIENIPYPSIEKPQFYRIEGNQYVYGNYDK